MMKVIRVRTRFWDIGIIITKGWGVEPEEREEWMMSVMSKGRETELDKVSGICLQVDNLDFIMRGYWTTGWETEAEKWGQGLDTDGQGNWSGSILGFKCDRPGFQVCEVWDSSKVLDQCSRWAPRMGRTGGRPNWITQFLTGLSSSSALKTDNTFVIVIKCHTYIWTSKSQQNILAFWLCGWMGCTSLSVYSGITGIKRVTQLLRFIYHREKICWDPRM